VVFNFFTEPNVTWRFRGERAGFFGTQLLITPHGPDFDYAATAGALKMALVPDLYLVNAHVLITKTLLTIYDVDLAPDSRSDGRIHGEGHANIGKDKSVDFKAKFDRMPISPWLPATWKGHLTGSGSGEVHWAGETPKLENSSGAGSLHVRNGRIENLPLLEKLAEFARNKSFQRLDLDGCSLNFVWQYPQIDIKEVGIEEKGKFRIEGAISIERRSLHGTLRLGLTPRYLDWLPNPREIFNREQSGYLWTRSQPPHCRTFQRIARRLSRSALSPVRRLVEESVWRGLIASRN
jgi:hypothetical protein